MYKRQALSAGDWKKVGSCADKIKKLSSSGGSVASATISSALVPTSEALQSVQSTDTNDSEMAKKQTIEKLIRAQKWKGVSIMAGLYSVESNDDKMESPKKEARSVKPKQSSWAGMLGMGRSDDTASSPAEAQTEPPQTDFETIELGGDIEDARK